MTPSLTCTMSGPRLAQHAAQRTRVRRDPRRLARRDEPAQAVVLHVPGVRERRHRRAVHGRAGRLEEARRAASGRQDVRVPFVRQRADQQREAPGGAARLRAVVDEEDAGHRQGPVQVLVISRRGARPRRDLQRTSGRSVDPLTRFAGVSISGAVSHDGGVHVARRDDDSGRAMTTRAKAVFACDGFLSPWMLASIGAYLLIARATSRRVSATTASSTTTSCDGSSATTYPPYAYQFGVVYWNLPFFVVFRGLQFVTRQRCDRRPADRDRLDLVASTAAVVAIYHVSWRLLRELRLPGRRGRSS